MQFSTTILTALFLTSSVFVSALPQAPDASLAIPELEDSASALNATGTDEGIDDNLDGEPDFDPAALTQDEGAIKLADRSLYDEADGFEAEGQAVEESRIESRKTAAQKVVDCARSYKGTKYKFGACKASAPFGPQNGYMDCSCLSRTCTKKGAGVTIPRTTKTQYPTRVGRCHKVARKSAKPGDLVFWGCKGSSTRGIHHVGIYSKKNFIVHAPKPGKTVQEVKIWSAEICPSVVRCW